MRIFFAVFIPVTIISYLVLMLPTPITFVLAYSVIVSLLITIIYMLKGEDESDKIPTVPNEEIERELEKYIKDKKV